MSGKWIKRKADEHVCDKPKYEGPGDRVAPDDQWKCECGRVWVVSGVWRGDQRESLRPGQYPTIQWRIDF